MTVFQHTDFKLFLEQFIKSQPKDGYGQIKRMAEHLKLSSSTISLIFKGERHLSEEQAFDLAEFLGLNAREADYFILLVRYEKAGSAALKKYLLGQIRSLQEQEKNLAKRLPQDTKLNDETKAIYYSDWTYAAARVAASLPDLGSSQDIATRLGMTKSKANEVCTFLLQHGLLISENGCLEVGPAHIHLEAQSPFIRSRQVQWRLRGFTKMEDFQADHLFYTAPMSLSLTARDNIREKLSRLIEEAIAEVADSKPTELYCLNIDWFAI